MKSVAEVWKWLVGVLVALILGGMVTALTDAQQARADAAAAVAQAAKNADKKLDCERAKEQFAPRDAVVRLQSDVEYIKKAMDTQAEQLGKLLDALRRDRRR